MPWVMLNKLPPAVSSLTVSVAVNTKETGKGVTVWCPADLTLGPGHE